MRRKLRLLLVVTLAAFLAVSSVALADPEISAQDAESDSNGTQKAGARERTFFWDPIAHYFRAFDLTGLFNHVSDSVEAFPADNSDIMPNNEAFDAACEALSGRVIGIDPGHQLNADYALEELLPSSGLTEIRQSAGCTGVRSGVPEYRINLLVSFKLCELLEKCGANVVFTHTDADVNLSNAERARLMNENGAEVWVRLHCNACNDASLSGACVLIPSAEVTPDIYPASYMLGLCLTTRFTAVMGTDALRTVELVTLDNQTGFNWSAVPVAAVEMGYLTNRTDDARLNSNAYQTRCAIGVFNGLADYFTALSAEAESAEAVPAEAVPSEAAPSGTDDPALNGKDEPVSDEKEEPADIPAE